MKKTTTLLCGIASMMLLSTPMFADTLFNFSFTGNDSVSGSPGTPFSGSGQFDAIDTSTAGKLKIIGVTGMTDDLSISSIIAKGGYGFNDNFLFFTSGDAMASLDNSGVSYQLSNGVDVNLFYGVPGQYQQSLFGFPGELVSEDQTANVTITPVGAVSPTPEPGTMMLLGTGMLGVVGFARRRFTA
jgi:hypothetical protein